MKRTILILFGGLLLSAGAVKAQTPLAFGSMNSPQPFFRHFNQLPDSNSIHPKWFFSKYAGISTGFFAFNGGSGTFFSAPVGVQVYHPLTNNVYAFAGVSVAPSFFPSSAFYQPMVNKTNSFMTGNNFGIYSSAQMGLMYINDDRTFSISGSIGVSNYNSASRFYSPAHYPVFHK